jgi:hypothetical protein
MKHLILFVLFSLSAVVSSCSKNEDTSDLSSIAGKWKWIESKGGFAGGTKTPASTGKIINLQISNTQVKKYENGILIAAHAYTIESLPSIFGGEKPTLVYDNNEKQSYEIIGNQLNLNDECHDCYVSKFVKEEN